MASSAGYYDVRIDIGAHTYIHTVYAASDYAAAIKVRKVTGFMPKSDSDVIQVSHDKSPEPYRDAYDSMILS